MEFGNRFADLPSGIHLKLHLIRSTVHQICVKIVNEHVTTCLVKNWSAVFIFAGCLTYFSPIQGLRPPGDFPGILTFISILRK